MHLAKAWALMAGVVYLSSFVHVPPRCTPISAVQAVYDAYQRAFLTSVDSLYQASAQEASLPLLRQRFRQCRLAWKRLEPIAAFVDPYAALQINAPDVLRIVESKKGQLTQYEPSGLQVIERYLYGESDSLHYAALIDECQQLVKATHEYAGRSAPLRDPVVWAALKQEILRMATLGIAGFDTALAQMTPAELAAACEGIAEYWKPYSQEEDKDANDTLVTALHHRLQAAVAYFGQQERNVQWDRLYALRELFRPLYAQFTEHQHRLGVPLIDAVHPAHFSVVEQEKDLWHVRLLRPAAFTSQPFVEVADTNLIALGKRLFHSPQLSRTGRRACATCHQPGQAFASHLLKDSVLDGHTLLKRNTPSLWNVIFQRQFLWDGSVKTLNGQFTTVMFNPLEMGVTEVSLLKQLQDTSWKTAFERAFGANNVQGGIRLRHVQVALEVYLQTLKGFDSPFDRYVRKETAFLHKNAYQGFNLFMGKAKCGTCHFAPLFGGTRPPDFADTETEVIGTLRSPEEKRLDDDLGRSHRTGLPQHQGSFKTPTVRNVSLTAPYMHHGTYKTIEQVLDFYNRGGGTGHGIKVPFQTLDSRPLQLTRAEMRQIKAFLWALTEKQF